MVLRPARIADAEAVAEIWSRGWRDGHLGNVPDALLAFRTPESFGPRAAARVDDTVVATIDDVVVGFVMVVGDEVEQVYVAADQRGTGTAAALLGEAERRVQASGHDQAWLAVVAGNARARRFYERNQWLDTGAFDYPAEAGDGQIVIPVHRYVKHVARP